LGAFAEACDARMRKINKRHHHLSCGAVLIEMEPNAKKNRVDLGQY